MYKACGMTYYFCSDRYPRTNICSITVYNKGNGPSVATEGAFEFPGPMVQGRFSFWKLLMVTFPMTI